MYTNVGKARVTGVELDLEAEPTEHWLFTTSIGTVDFKYQELGAAEGTGLTLDTKAPGVPDFKASATAQFFAGAGGRAAIRGAYTYQSKVYWDDANTAPSAQDGYGLLNGRVSWSSDGKLWEAAPQVNNVLGKEYYSMLIMTPPRGTVVGTVGAAPDAVHGQPQVRRQVRQESSAYRGPARRVPGAQGLRSRESP
ncbi:MAG: TonB-dependent receptor [Candidatus Binatia bacterium]